MTLYVDFADGSRLIIAWWIWQPIVGLLFVGAIKGLDPLWVAIGEWLAQRKGV